MTMQYVVSIPKNVWFDKVDVEVTSVFVNIITTVLVSKTTVANQQNSKKLNFLSISFKLLIIDVNINKTIEVKKPFFRGFFPFFKIEYYLQTCT